MRSILRLLWVPILALGGGLFYGIADEPLAPAKDSGTVLILQEYRTWEGDIVRKGNKYIVNKYGRPIITIPKEEVIRLCRDWDDVHVFMKSQVNLSDPDERKKLAEFFLVNRVPEIAMIEIKEALKIRPEDSELKRLKGIIQREIDNPRPSPGPAALKNNSPPEEQLDITQASRTRFMNEALPVLLDRCYKCHSGGRGGKFQLYRTHEVGQLNAGERSLKSVILQIDMDKWDHSRLLFKALSPHGNQPYQAPFRTRNEDAFKRLQDWVKLVVEDNPYLTAENTPPYRGTEGSPVRTAKLPQPRPILQNDPNLHPRGLGSSGTKPDFASWPDHGSEGKLPNALGTPSPPVESDPPWKKDSSTGMDNRSPFEKVRPPTESPKSPGSPSPGEKLRPTHIDVDPPSPPTKDAPLPDAVSPPQSRLPSPLNVGQEMPMANNPRFAPVQTAFAGPEELPHKSLKITPAGVIGVRSTDPSNADEKQAPLPHEVSAPLRLSSGVKAQAQPLPSNTRPGSLGDGPAPPKENASKAVPIPPIQIIPVVAPSQPVAPVRETTGDLWSPDIFNNYMPLQRR